MPLVNEDQRSNNQDFINNNNAKTVTCTLDNDINWERKKNRIIKAVDMDPRPPSFNIIKQQATEQYAKYKSCQSNGCKEPLDPDLKYIIDNYVNNK